MEHIDRMLDWFGALLGVPIPELFEEIREDIATRMRFE